MIRGLAVGVVALAVTVAVALTATNVVAGSRTVGTNTAIDANALKSAACAGIDLTAIRLGNGGGTGNFLRLGTTGNDSLNSANGNECIVGGAGNDSIRAKRGPACASAAPASIRSTPAARRRSSRAPPAAGGARASGDWWRPDAPPRTDHYDPPMRLEILGSGGATAIPRPGCVCHVCEEARAKGLPYTRTGPSAFLHGAGILFDTPEESRLQLDRAGVAEVAACFYSHWHPDHTMGRRVFETANADFRAWPPERKRGRVTDVYLPEQVAADFRTYLGGHDHLAFMEHQGWIRVHELRDGDGVTIAGVEVRPFRLAESYVYAFELRAGGKRILLALDELKGWTPPAAVRGADLAVIPRGIDEHDPFTGERRIHPDHPVLAAEATFPETLAIVDRLGAARTVLSHIEEIDGLSHDDLLRLADTVGRGVEFAYDGLVLDV